MKHRIKIKDEGVSQIHIACNFANSVTLCGMDGDDPGIQQATTGYPKRGKITCPHCKQIAEEGRQWSASDFA